MYCFKHQRHDTTINTYHINTIFGNVNLKCVNNTKNLGIIVDNDLSFVEHINKKSKSKHAWSN